MLDPRSIPQLADWVAPKAEKKRKKAEEATDKRNSVHIITLLARHYAELGMSWEKFSKYWEVSTLPDHEQKRVLRKFKQFRQASDEEYPFDPTVPEALAGVVANEQRRHQKERELAGRVAYLEVIIDEYVAAGAKEKMWDTIAEVQGIKELPWEKRDLLERRFQHKIDTIYLRDNRNF